MRDNDLKLSDLLESDEEISLVIQGGGMRGTYGIAALNQLAELGYTNRFKDVYATSAGALNACYFLSGQTEIGITAYTDHLSNREFIDFRRPKKIIDIDYLVDVVLQNKVCLDIPAMESSPSELHIGALESSRGEIEWFECRNKRWSIFETLRATAALPIVYGREVQLGDKYYSDGGLQHNVPIHEAVDRGAKNVLVILTKPHSFRPTYPSKIDRALCRRLARLRNHSSGVIDRLGVFDSYLFESMELVCNGFSAESNTRIWSIAPSENIVGRLTRDRDELLQTADVARKDVIEQLALRSGRNL